MVDTSPPFNVEPELPPVPILPAEGLSLLRDVIISLWIEWGADPEERIFNFMDILKEILKKPLLRFDEGYEEFKMHLNAHDMTNEMHDMWRIFQMTLFTELGKDRESILNDFVLMVRRTLADAPTGEQLVVRQIQPTDQSTGSNNPVWMSQVKNNLSILTLLIVKVYITSVRVREVPKEEGK